MNKMLVPETIHRNDKLPICVYFVTMIYIHTLVFVAFGLRFLKACLNYDNIIVFPCRAPVIFVQNVQHNRMCKVLMLAASRRV